MTSSTADDARFAALLDDARREMPDARVGVANCGGLPAALGRAVALRELELLLRRTTNLREARLLLFFPEPVDMLRYVALIARPPAGAPADHLQSKVRVPFLALLYMRHVRSWALVRQFILEGGLGASDRVADDNVYLRSQAIDTLMQITSTDLHDWFAEAPLEPAVHRRWLDLMAPSAKFMAHVAINLDKPTPPAARTTASQIVAFWLSLLRYFYCEQRVLRLGAEVMARFLKRWAASTADGVSAEERELAQKLVDDFGRFPTVDGMHGQADRRGGHRRGGGSAAAADVIMEETVGAPERLAPVTEAATPVPAPAAADGEAGRSCCRRPMRRRRRRRRARRRRRRSSNNAATPRLRPVRSARRSRCTRRRSRWRPPPTVTSSSIARRRT